MNHRKGDPVFKVIKGFRIRGAAADANINSSLTLKLRQSSWFSHMVLTLADEMLEGFGRPLILD